MCSSRRGPAMSPVWSGCGEVACVWVLTSEAPLSPTPYLGHVPDNKHGASQLLCQPQQRRTALPNLLHAACATTHPTQKHRLYGIHHHSPGAQRRGLLQDAVHAGGTEQHEVGGGGGVCREACGAVGHLCNRLLSRDVEHGAWQRVWACVVGMAVLVLISMVLITRDACT